MFARVPDKGNNRVREEQEHVRSALDCDTQMTWQLTNSRMTLSVTEPVRSEGLSRRARYQHPRL